VEKKLKDSATFSKSLNFPLIAKEFTPKLFKKVKNKKNPIICLFPENKIPLN